MDPSSIASGVGTAVGATKGGYQVWNWFWTWRYGSIEIIHPNHLAVISQVPWVEISGKHKHPSGIYWLLTRDRDEYWPKHHIQLGPDGRWSGRVHVDIKPGPRTSFVMLSRVSEYTHSFFLDYRKK